MKPAVRWSISAAMFVAMFVGARIYVGRLLTEERAVDAGGPRLPAATRVPGPEPEPVGDLAFDLRRAVNAGLAEGADRGALHREIEGLGTVEVAPEDLERVLAAFSELEASAEGAKAVDVQAHLVALRAGLLERAGRPDAALAERLAAWEASDPAAFAWRATAAEVAPEGGPEPVGEPGAPEPGL